MSRHNRDTASAVPSPTQSDAPAPPLWLGAAIIVAAATLLLTTLGVVAVTNPDTRPDAGAGTGAGAGAQTRGVVGAVLVGHIYAIAAGLPLPGKRWPGRHPRRRPGPHRRPPRPLRRPPRRQGGGTSNRRSGVIRVGYDAGDVMALTNAEPGRLLAGGHPDTSDTHHPSNLSLVDSRDDGRTWRPVSLGGAADFHALEQTASRTRGIDAATGGLVTSTDERVWKTISERPLLDLAVDPSDPDEVLVTTGAGDLIEVSTDGSPELRETGPRLDYVDWPGTDALVGVDAAGVVYRSTDAGNTWHELGRVTGTPTALSVIDDRWYTATSDGLFRGDLDPETDTNPDADGDADGDANSGVGPTGQVTRILTFTD